MVGVSTAQVASLLNSAFQKSNITHKVVQHLVGTGVFTDVSTSRSVRVELDDVLAFTAATRVVTPDQWPEGPLFRVSLLKLRENPVLDVDGVTTLRTHSGADYSHSKGLSPLMHERAWTGVWDASKETIRKGVDERAILFGTTKGYIHPDHVRTIIGVRRAHGTRRIMWETEPASAAVKKFVGTGLWMDVPPGRISDWA